MHGDPAVELSCLLCCGWWLQLGLTTMYNFWAYPDNTRLRLSQILVLPPYQEAGLGKHMLQVGSGELALLKCQAVLNRRAGNGVWICCLYGALKNSCVLHCGARVWCTRRLVCL